MAKKIAVFGSPILHSKSTEIYNFLFDISNITAYYTRSYAKNVAEVIQMCHIFSLNGANITSPLKKTLAACCDTLSSEAKKTNAVNTIAIQNK